MAESKDHRDFIGVENLIAEHKAQLEKFRVYAQNHDWHLFHNSHYDWWAFPIDFASSFGFKYSVSQESIAKLSDNPIFRSDLAEGARLLLTSWGWDWRLNRPLDFPEPGQEWANWPIRLFKAWYSMEIFGNSVEADSNRKYAEWLYSRGISFQYGERNLYQEIMKN